MDNNIKYEDALAQIEDIVRRMENDQLDIDSLASQLKQAQQLIKLCKDRLTAVDAEVKKILDGGTDE